MLPAGVARNDVQADHVDTVVEMTWRGFLQWLRPDFSGRRQPGSVRNMTPEELAERRRRSANMNMFGIQIFDLPPSRPYKAPWPDEDEDAE